MKMRTALNFPQQKKTAVPVPKKKKKSVVALNSEAAIHTNNKKNKLGKARGKNPMGKGNFHNYCEKKKIE